MGDDGWSKVLTGGPHVIYIGNIFFRSSIFFFFTFCQICNFFAHAVFNYTLQINVEYCKS